MKKTLENLYCEKCGRETPHYDMRSDCGEFFLGKACASCEIRAMRKLLAPGSHIMDELTRLSEEIARDLDEDY